MVQQKLPFNFKTGQPVVWYHRNPSQSNRYCLYCARFVGPDSEVDSNKEHLIGRNFVPQGTLDRDSFNFIFRACVRCNNEKSVAERHLSTVTLFSSRARAIDPAVEELAAHKASRDFHPLHKGTKVDQSGENLNVVFTFGPMSGRVSLAAPPQPDPCHLAVLARMQVQALFSLVTSRDPTKHGCTNILVPSRVHIFGYYLPCDWGNPQLVELASRAQSWTSLASVIAANGFFKATLRRPDDDKRVWFWALEWNQSIRVVGAIFQEGGKPPLFEDLPPLVWRDLHDGSGRLREESPLRDEEDNLFRTKPVQPKGS